MATTQRPVSLAALQEKSTAPAWKTIPSWYLTGRQDEAIDPAAERFMAHRAKAHSVEINSSHASYVSHPADITKLILEAARACLRRARARGGGRRLDRLSVPHSFTDLAGLNASAEDFLAAVLETAAQPIWVVDPDGLIRFANPAAIAALGL